MKRTVAWAAGIAATAFLGLALGPTVGAEEKAAADTKAEKVEKHVVVRHVDSVDEDARAPKVERKVVIRRGGAAPSWASGSRTSKATAAVRA